MDRNGAHSLWWDARLSFDGGGRGLVLPQLNMSDIVDSPWEGWMGDGWGGGVGGYSTFVLKNE